EPQLPGTLFIIGKPNDYHLTGPLPRLPSYESVRKEDRQRNIHSMIAQRFDLSGSHDEVHNYEIHQFSTSKQSVLTSLAFIEQV
ncbi:hypothetical protein XENOCAPTIV_015162, partial [Xenoophorus captivus]